jgi:ankyrin repeat protein
MVHGDTGYQMAELLLQHGARPNFCEGEDHILSDSPLLAAGKRAGVAAATLLLCHGADPNVADGQGLLILDSVAHHALFRGMNGTIYEEILRLLLANGAHPATDHTGKGLKHEHAMALVRGHAGNLTQLLERAARWWSQSGFKIVTSTRRGVKRTPSKGCQSTCTASEKCFDMPEVLNVIVSFL